MSNCLIVLGGAERQWTNPFAVLHNVGNSAAGLLGGLTSSLTNAGTDGNEETGGTGSTAVAGGSGMVDPESGQAVGTGTGIVDAGPNGFGVALGVGGAIDTPFGTHTFGQGNSVAIDGPQLPFGNFAANG